MPTHNELVALRERVRNATGPDRDLDYALARALLPDFHSTILHTLALYTSSLDASVALCERLLPGWHWTVERGGWAQLFPEDFNAPFVGAAATGPLALLDTILSALIA